MHARVRQPKLSKIHCARLQLLMLHSAKKTMMTSEDVKFSSVSLSTSTSTHSDLSSIHNTNTNSSFTSPSLTPTNTQATESLGSHLYPGLCLFLNATTVQDTTLGLSVPNMGKAVQSLQPLQVPIPEDVSFACFHNSSAKDTFFVPVGSQFPPVICTTNTTQTRILQNCLNNTRHSCNNVLNSRFYSELHTLPSDIKEKEKEDQI